MYKRQQWIFPCNDFAFVHNTILKLIKAKQLSNTLWRIQKLGFKNNIILTLWKLQNKSNYNILHNKTKWLKKM